QKTAYEIFTLLEFRRVLFRSHIRRAVAGDDGFCQFLTHFGGPALRHVPLPTVVEGFAAGRRVAIGRIVGGAAAAWRRRYGHGNRSEERRVGKEWRAQCERTCG